MNGLRVFLALFPPPEVQAAAAAAIDRLRGPGDRVSWVKPENLHYTLRFLGEVEESDARRAGEAAAEAAAAHRAFDAALGGLGAFPDGGRARVLWVGLSEGEEPMLALAREVERSLERRGFEPEARPFAAHLTIGRVRDPGRDWTEALVEAAPPAARWRVDRVLLIRSTLSPEGSRYAEIAAAPLVR
jgi:2'-5' RNA ligase